MKKFILFIFILLFYIQSYSQAIIADHRMAKLDQIPESAITLAKTNLHIVYWHTSHGSQITEGMDGLIGKTNLFGYKGDIYRYNNGGTNGALDLDDNYITDLGQNGDTSWAPITREYLNDPNNSDINVVMWSWCGGVSGNTEEGINIYLNKMNQLEQNYPDVKFVYMTGHLDGGGLTGNLHVRNEQIRNYCITNNKILFDFADIESYDPDGNYFLNKAANDNCDYDSDGNGSLESNWAIAWQEAHTLNYDWYDCGAAHSQPINANQKTYAIWWLWSSIAGWDDPIASVKDNESITKLYIEVINYPNPSTANTKLVFDLPEQSNVSIKVFSQSGAEVMKINIGNRPKGKYEYILNTSDLNSGLYFYQICSGNFEITKKLIKQ